MPERYREGYLAGLDDPLVQREQKRELSVIDELAKEAFSRFDTGESGGVWDALGEAVKDCGDLESEIAKARADGDQEGEAIAKERLLAIFTREVLPIIRRGAGEEGAKRELLDLYERRSKLIKIQADTQRTVPIEILGILIYRMAAILVEEVEDGGILFRCVARIRKEPIPGLENALKVGSGNGKEGGRGDSKAARDGDTKTSARPRTSQSEDVIDLDVQGSRGQTAKTPAHHGVKTAHLADLAKA